MSVKYFTNAKTSGVIHVPDGSSSTVIHETEFGKPGKGQAFDWEAPLDKDTIDEQLRFEKTQAIRAKRRY